MSVALLLTGTFDSVNLPLKSVVVVTSGLHRRLDEPELDAVLAHELAHIANRDAAVMSLASVPRSIGATIAGAGSDMAFYLWFFIWPIGLILSTPLTLCLVVVGRHELERGESLHSPLGSMGLRMAYHIPVDVLVIP